jgi:phosphohistidine swiveling domain-containing protein
MWVRPLADADETCGAKAANLARLIAAGLPVPDGFVVGEERPPVALDEVGHQLEAERKRIADEVEDAAIVERAARIAGTLAVRSSASLEDGEGGSAAGVFESIVNVRARTVWDAIRAVRTSALTPLAAAYGRGTPIAIAVIVQRFVAGERMTIYTRPPGKPEERRIIVQRGDEVRECGRDDVVDPFVAFALRAEGAIGAARGADVELVIDREGAPWVVQARPIVHPPAPSRTAPPPALLAALVADGRPWHWDVGHNPDPLSPAQTSLVERVERAGVAPWSMRVCAGHLYTTGQAPVVEPDFARAAAIEAQFATLLDVDDDGLTIDDAVARYLTFYAAWSSQLVPLIAAGRRGLTPEALVGARPSAVEATLLAAARGTLDEETALARLAPLSPAWDVAVPTFGEQPAIIRAAIERARQRDLPEQPIVSDEVARAAADLAERDDVWFAKAQRLVRRALLRRGRALGIPDEDICWLSLDDLTGGLEPHDATRRASAARAAAARQAKWAMPLIVNGDARDDRDALHGVGSGARIAGRVVRFASLASAVAVSSGDIIVTRAITPALAVFVVGCAAIVSETGGPLDHGAAIARELGVPFVVGCKDAWSLLTDGMIVTIEGDRVFPTRS